jgi:hypothetical protein
VSVAVDVSQSDASLWFIEAGRVSFFDWEISCRYLNQATGSRSPTDRRPAIR